jgi:hypothetical protein
MKSATKLTAHSWAFTRFSTPLNENYKFEAFFFFLKMLKHFTEKKMDDFYLICVGPSGALRARSLVWWHFTTALSSGEFVGFGKGCTS